MFLMFRVSTFLELHYAFGLLDPCREKDTDIILFHLLYGFPNCREDKVPPTLVLPPTLQKVVVGTVVAKAYHDANCNVKNGMNAKAGET